MRSVRRILESTRDDLVVAIRKAREVAGILEGRLAQVQEDLSDVNGPDGLPFDPPPARSYDPRLPF